MLSPPSPGLYYLTTPIYYGSDVPHIGHAYTTIIGDALCRYERIQRGAEHVFYLTGTDEHGEKIERAAAERGLGPQAFVDQTAAAYKDVWRALNVHHDDFIRTTEARHEKVVQRLWTTLVERDDIYKADYEGLYCVACESFYLEKDLLPGNLCPDHKRKVELVKEEGYFFRLSKYEKPLLDYYTAHPDFVEPQMRLNEVRAFVERGLRDLSVSRSSFSWGVKVPGDPKHVIYVWIDALANYYSAVQEPPERRAFWGTREAPGAIHVIGKDISRFHAVYWPAVLLSAGLPLPKKVLTHGWWTVDGEKMSKTLGNVIDPRALAADIGADTLRYFMLREMPIGPDGDFSYDALINRYNSELCNDLGNLLNRTLAMVEKFSGGAARRWPPDREPHSKDSRLREAAEKTRQKVEDAMTALQPSRALEALFALVREGNTYVEREAYPLTRTSLEEAGHALYNVLEVLRWLSLMLEPFIPERAVEIRRQLGLPQPESAGWPARFGDLPDGTVVRKGATLFPRIEEDRKQELLGKWRAARRAADAHARETAPPAAEAGKDRAAEKAAAAPVPEVISFDEWKRLDLRVAVVLKAERVLKKDRLLKVVVDLGPGGHRTVVAGLAQHIAPEALEGRRVAFLANLKPARIGGIESQGMILAVGGDDILGLLQPDHDVPPGTPIR